MVADFKQRGAKAISVVADVTDASAVAAMVERTAREFGRIDILVNNAGINIRKPPHVLAIDEWDSIIKTNLTSAFLCSQAVYPAMKAAGGGKIINIGSMMSIFGSGFTPAYAASKGGIVQFTRSCAVAWASDNIQANAVLPGWIDTDLTQARAPRDRRAARQGSGTHARRAMGRDRGLRGHRRVPEFSGVGLRHGHRDPGRWRIFGEGIIASERTRFVAIDPCISGVETMKPRSLLAASAICLFSGAASAQNMGWQHYAVPVTGANVEFPAAIFSRDAGEPDVGYGRRFVTSDGRANLTIQSFPNDANDSPAAFLAKQSPPPGIMYRRVTPRFFAVSSQRSGKIWYNRCNSSGRFMNCVLINYPAAEKRQWDGVVTRISRTLTSRS